MEEAGASETGAEDPMDGSNRDSNYWQLGIPRERILFVDSKDSEEFNVLLAALDGAKVVAMDAEWKPNRKAGSVPRVSILQLSCRMDNMSMSWASIESILSSMKLRAKASMESLKAKKVGINLHRDDSHRLRMLKKVEGAMEGLSVSNEQVRADGAVIAGRRVELDVQDEEVEGGDIELETDVHSNRDLVDESDVGQDEVGLDSTTEGIECTRGGEEVIFVLDLLALSAADFSCAMKRMLCSPGVLKLGFAFKQDQLNLAASFPGPEANGCFDKVEPYLDIANLYKQLLQLTSVNVKRQGRRFVVGGTYSLTGISKAVLGVGLCKDSQCSNWEQRPLSPEQIEYAAADTQCLLAIFDTLLSKAVATMSPSTASAVAGGIILGPLTSSGIEVVFPGDPTSLSIRHRQSSLHEAREGGLKLLTGGTQEKTSTGIVVSHKMGIAKEMVEAAVHPPFLLDSVPFEKQENISLQYAKVVKRYTERLLVGEESPRKTRVPRPRGRRAREALKNPDAKKDWNWIGPAPWDVRIGGDGKPKFMCGDMLEGLARQLRCVGIDAATPATKRSARRRLVEHTIEEGRILLTKDIRLLRQGLLPDNMSYFVKKLDKWEQLEEVMKVFEISISESSLLSRCVKCNGSFLPNSLTSKEAMAAAPWEQEIPASILETCNEFWQCSICRHVFWQLHYFFKERLRSILKQAENQQGALMAP